MSVKYNKYKTKYIDILTESFLVEEYIKNQKSTSKIAKELVCSHTTISKYLIKYNIPIRTLSETKKAKNHPLFGKENKWGHHTEEVKQIMSDKMKGRKRFPFSDEWKKNISLAGKGKPKPEGFGESRSRDKAWNWKGGKPKCIDCNKELSNYGHIRCLDCFKIFESEHPELNGNYKGGVTPLHLWIRSLQEYENWHIRILKRDNYTCQDCSQHGGNLEVHHEKSFAKLLKEFLQEYDQFSPIEDKETLVRLAIKWQPFWNTDNGITYCTKCHKENYIYLKENVNGS